MRTLLQLLLLAALAFGAYLYFVPGSYEAITKSIPFLQKKDPATGLPLIDCPTCAATGSVKCAARGCVDGKVECDGPCLRLTKGRWIKNAKWGKGPDELWFEFPKNKGYAAVTKGHVGEVWEIKDGTATNLGKCKICDGTTLMPCKVCNGTAQVPCKTCHGSKEIPDNSSSSPEKPAAPAPAAKSSMPPPPKPTAIRLKDGSTITGNIIIRDTDFVVIRTPDGKTTQISKNDLAP